MLLYTNHSIQSFGPLKVLYTSLPNDLFITTQTRLLWEAFSHAATAAKRLFALISTAAYSQLLIYTAERTGASWKERKCQGSKRQQGGFEPKLSRLRVRHYSTKLLRSITVPYLQVLLSWCGSLYMLIHIVSRPQPNTIVTLGLK